MTRSEMQAEREDLEAWMVKVAAIPFSTAEQETYNQVRYRADELYCFEAMSR